MKGQTSDWSNFDILRFLQQKPGRLREFLSQVPINDLKTAIEDHQLHDDLRFKSSRDHQAYKKNVLDFTLEDVISACYNEGIINYFQRKLAFNSTRIQNHPQYGFRLATRLPEKYYVGQKSGHYNQAKKIQKAYGIKRARNSDQGSRAQRGNSVVGDDSERSSYQYEESQSKVEDKDQSGQQQDNQENSDDEESNDSFIDDQYQQELEIGSDEEEIGGQEEIIILQSDKAEEQKFGIKQEEKKRNISQRQTTHRKLKKEVLKNEEQINVDQYLLAHSFQGQLSKKQQKSLKQEEKIQSQQKVSLRQQRGEDEQNYDFKQSTKKTNKMKIQLD